MRQQSEHPGVTVRQQVSEGSARAALRRAGAEAQMVVVGARGRGGIQGLPIGSVGVAVLCSARSPVGIVHPTEPTLGSSVPRTSAFRSVRNHLKVVLRGLCWQFVQARHSAGRAPVTLAADQ